MSETPPADLKAEKKQIGRPFVKGQVANPKGRPKGSRNKLGEAFIAALHSDFEEHGVEAIEKVRKDKPDAYLRVVAAVVPKELNVTHSTLDELSDDELAIAVEGLRAFVNSDLVKAVGDGTAEQTRH